MENKKSLGGIQILIGSIFFNIFAALLAYQNIYSLIMGGNRLAMNGGMAISIMNILLSLIIFIVAIFGIRQRNNIDAGDAILKRGIFVMALAIILGAVRFYVAGFNTVYLQIVLDALIYIVGGKLNKVQAEREYMQ